MASEDITVRIKLPSIQKRLAVNAKRMQKYLKSKNINIPYLVCETVASSAFYSKSKNELTKHFYEQFNQYYQYSIGYNMCLELANNVSYVKA